MDASAVRAWKAGLNAVNAFELEEKRQRTPRERLRLAQVLLNRLAAMNALSPRTEELEYHRKWQRVRERWCELHPES